MDNGVIDIKNGVCAICRKKEVSRWCDYIIKYDNSINFFRDRKKFLEASRYAAGYETCDLPMCEDCAINVSLDTYICPHHYKLLAQADLTDPYQRERQAREKRMIASELIHGTQ